MPISKNTAVDVGLFIASQVVLWYGVKWIFRQMDPLRGKKEESAAQTKKLFERLNLPAVELNEYEQIIATEIIHPDDIFEKFEDIGGLDDILDALKEAVIYPLTLPHLFKGGSKLLGPPKGVLLYGPPGCGKTLIAKALAKESGAIFVNLHVSTLTEKWFGESQKLVKGVFSLAKKLQPCIIFIDEIDAFLRERQSSDHEVTGMMKAEFMSLWDGLSSGTEDRVLILGATNRYNDIDKAIIRRMPKRFPVALPKEAQRVKILKILLKDTNVVDKEQTLLQVAMHTQGLSGSDLKELCRNASLIPVREYFKRMRTIKPEFDVKVIDEDGVHSTRALILSDFISASVTQETSSRNQLVFEEPLD